MSEIAKAYTDLPNSELEKYLAIASEEFTAEQITKISFYKLAKERGLV